MKKIIFTAAIFLTGTMAFASTSVKSVELTENLLLAPCSVTTTMCCEGSGTIVSSTSTSPSGDCGAAAIASAQQWKTDCRGETIRRIISEDMEA